MKIFKLTKFLLLSLSMIIFLNSCVCEKQPDINVINTAYIPVEEYNISKPFYIEPEIESEEINGEIKVYVVFNKDDFDSLKSYTKKLRLDYNSLLVSAKYFNNELRKLTK